MITNESTGGCYDFGAFRLSPEERSLTLDGQPVHLPPKVFDTLLLLVENSGHLIGKDDLLEKVWADAIVEEGTLVRNISILRKVLGENENHLKFIETVPKQGYRFTQPVYQRSVKEDWAPVLVDKQQIPEIEKSVSPTSRPVLWLMLGFVIITGIFTSLSFWRAKPVSFVDVSSIAVLPFKTIDSGPRDESLELGMANAVITRLGRIRHIVVRPPNAVLKYLGTEADSVQAGKDLQVEAVLEGTIQRGDDRVRVSARLIKTDDGSQMWTENFDVRLSDIFSVQDSISLQIAESLNLKLTGGERNSLTSHETDSPEAYQSYLKGEYFLEKRNLQKAIDYFTQAIVLDPNIAAAYTGLADAYAFEVSYTRKSPQENLPKARTAVEKALSLDEGSAVAHAALGHILWLEWDWQGAERSFHRALELNPNSAIVLGRYSVYLSSLGRHDEALAEVQRAKVLDPTSDSINKLVERTFYFARRYDEALEASTKTLELNPNSLHPNSWPEMALAQKGMYDASIETRFRAMLAAGVEAEKVETLRRIYQENGWQSFWRNQAEESKRQAEKRYVLPYNVARYYARAGDHEQALDWLEKCADEHSDHLTIVKVDPIFDDLHSAPRFAALLKRIGLN